MDGRPNLSTNLNAEMFREYYYLKEELAAFCRKNGLQSTGSKNEITNRIFHFLKTGEKLYTKPKVRVTTDIGRITEDTQIESDFVCTEKHRAFFEQSIGGSFKFYVPFQRWLKANGGKTYKDAIEAYYQILQDKRSAKITIDKQFEYNTYIRDFFNDNAGKTLKEAILCWKYKKSRKGHNRYEKSDLSVLKTG